MVGGAVVVGAFAAPVDITVVGSSITLELGVNAAADGGYDVGSVDALLKNYEDICEPLQEVAGGNFQLEIP